MKKFFAILAVVMFAVAANAEVLFQETFATRRASTYIVKAKTSSGEAWPYASQWFTGYEAKDATKNVVGNQFDNDYTTVASYGVSIRGKKLNGSNDNTVGLYFSKSPNQSGTAITAEKNYVQFEGALPEIPAEGTYFLHLEVSPQEGVDSPSDASKLVVKINGAAVTVPATALADQTGVTADVAIPLSAGQIESLFIAFDEVDNQKFISNIRIDAEAQGIENIVLTEKAQKVMVDGVVYVIRDGKMYNALGTQVR